MADSDKFDLAVLGSGPGGYVAAIRASQLGLKVAIIEREKMGGVCLNWGCIPTKALLKSAETLQLLRRASEFGLSVGKIEVDFALIIKRSRQVADRMSKGVAFLMKKNGISVFSGTGRFNRSAVVVISDESGRETASVRADRFLLATGARPRNLPGLELDGEKLISYRQAMTLAEPPRSLAIIGAGAIGAEFAYFYNAVGTEVTILEMLPQILPLEDAEAAKVVQNSFSKSGIKTATDARVEKVEKTGKGVKVHGSTPKGQQTWEADLCLVAVGVQANSDGIGLEDLGVEIEKGFVKVDDAYRTTVPDVWAIGDLIGAPMLAHAASHEGLVAVENMAGLPTRKIDPDRVPSCIYCQPQVASIGLTEEQAVEKGLKAKIGRFPFVATGKGLASSQKEGFVKLIFDQKGRKLLGAHVVGAEATEMIAELALAQIHDDPLRALTSVIHAHPTLSEAIAEAALDAVGRAVHL